MTKHCPNCGNEIDDNEMKCPECGFEFSEDKENNKNEAAVVEQEDSTHQTENTSSHFEADEKNENIEWADLKDLSIGHVMNLFNEQQGQAPLEIPKEEVSDKEMDEAPVEEAAPKSENEQPDDSAISEEQVSNDQINDTPDEESTEHISADHVEEEKSETDSLGTASLKEYINAHKEEQKSADDSTSDEEIETETEDKKADQSVDTAEETTNEEVSSLDKSEDSVKEADHEGYSEEQALEESTNAEEKQQTAVVIPSKSKKPEEIEMDAAPIFFEEKDILPSELGPKKRSQFATLDDAQRPQTPSTDSQKEEKKRTKKLPIALAAAAVLALGAGGWYYVQNQGDAPKQETKVEDTKKSLFEETEATLNSYFTDDKQTYLKPEMVSVSTQSLEKDLEKLKKEDGYTDLEKTLNTIKEKQALITKVNELYVSPVISGSSYKEEAIASDKEITLEKETGTDEFSKLINQAIDQAQAQYTQLEKAKNAVDVIYKDGQARSLLSQETYEAAVTEVNKVKNEELKKTLTASLDSAKIALAGDTAASSEPVVEQPTEAASEANQVVASNQESSAVVNAPSAETNTAVDPSTFTGPDSNGVYTSPVYTVIPEHVADTSNVAWIWAAGVKERVLATCMERGYIVDGGYYLEPARIVNGQGYYNLYKTDGTYLVTINAQTGWFKGNASRNAGR
ncbi:cell division site-positioning protein MapZ family protein [Candidatus Enterococcus clewellii]|uniref:Zinc-ribbon domain-containing protein n=1 Tax=Candidatus Enterococcus clewellii TaxID=1834193 RepID=A0A242KC19_9ENTE|nr:cell division site-positioning protein MapZ family protein [Enterococcus sp. 9E7_DIV0242]OTP18715.1 hypothetical protein A5888_000529 [Enterococcus sp. 9E7_DIV0242]